MQSFPKNLNFLCPDQRTRAYQGLRNVSFSENCVYALNWWPQRLQLFSRYHLTFVLMKLSCVFLDTILSAVRKDGNVLLAVDTAGRVLELTQLLVSLTGYQQSRYNSGQYLLNL